MAYYKTIKGKRYDRKLLELADSLTQGRGDGRISMADARRLLSEVQDAGTYTKIEKETIAYIRKNYKFTQEADTLFRHEIRSWAASKKKSKQTSTSKPAKKTRPQKKTSKKSKPSAGASQSGAANRLSSQARPLSGEPSPSGSVQKGRLYAFVALFFLVLGILLFLAWVLWGRSCSFPPSKTTQETQAERSGKTDRADRLSPNASQNSTDGKLNPAAISPKPADPAQEYTTDNPASLADFKEHLKQWKIHFAKNGRAPVGQDSKQTLAKLAAILKKNPKLRIEIRGHTSAEDRTGANQRISEERAEAVRRLLLRAGVPAKQLQTRGLGASEPAFSNDTQEGRQKNRRVEFRLIK